MKENKIKVSNKGEITIAVNGVKGGACKDLTKKLQDALGVLAKDTETAEMYEDAPQETLGLHGGE